ncbi:MAG: substrate-binding domain-containing protein [Prevotellaceae bacterium]|jgi:phosphate transport system substrate-binding protein|nr:substrate-binding domain-containing protein [Prevotellaceae bacterium]
MKMKAKSLLVFLLAICSFCACNRGSKQSVETPTQGRARIAVDETFRPIIDAELMVFHGIYGEATIEPLYLPANKLFEVLDNDSVRLIISSRRLTEEQKAFYIDKKLNPREVAIAKDAIAVIVNRENSDSLLTVEQIRQILAGKITSWKDINPRSRCGAVEVVFDNRNSSTVRYAIDSLCNGNIPSASYINALEINTDVIEYVQKNKGSIGFIGVSWISDRNDSTHLSFIDKVRVVSLSRYATADHENSYQPFQAYIFNDLYPFTRTMYAIVTDPRNGVPTGFTSFLGSDKGQRIILKSGIVPAVAPTRVVNVRADY